MEWMVESGRARVVVDLARGGRIASLVVDGHELLVQREDVMVDGVLDPLAWGCYVMAPWAGRVRDGRFAFGDRDHQLPLRPGQVHALHGTVLDRAWEQCGDLSWRTDFGPQWPFDGSVVATMALTDQDLQLRLDVRAPSDAMAAIVGWHPWFRRRLEGGADVVVDLAPTAAWVVDEDLLPTGEVEPVRKSPWDTPFVGMHRPPRLTWPGAVDLTLHSDARCWVVYSEPAHAICIEPQTDRPDAFNAHRRSPETSLAFRLSWT